MRKLLWMLTLLLIAPQALAAPDVQEVDGGSARVKAWLVEDHKLPILSLHFAFQGGSEQDPVDKQGLAALTVAALTEGAGDLSASAFQQQLADHSITLSFYAGRDEISGTLKCLSADKAKAFELLRLALTKPRFERAEVERLRAKHMGRVRNLFADPEWQARYAALSYLYEGHPYSQRQLGTLQTLASLTPEDMRDFADDHFARETLTVGAAGDIRPGELAEALDDVFGDLPLRAKLAPVDDAPEKNATSVLVRREGTQTNVLLFMPGPKRNDADYYAAEIANYILGGGGFSSRLMQDMRDKKGLTYGVSTFLAPSQHAGLIMGHAAVGNQKAAEALALIRSVMRGFYEDKPSAKEIEAAKDYLTGSTPLALTSTHKIADILVTMQREDLGRDYLTRYPKIIRAVTSSDVHRVIDRWFNPDKMTLAMAGKPVGVSALQVRETVRK